MAGSPSVPARSPRTVPWSRSHGGGVGGDRDTHLVGTDPPLVRLDRVGVGADREVDERELRGLAPLPPELLEEQQRGDEHQDALVGSPTASPRRRPSMPPANRDASSMSAIVTLLGGSAGAHGARHA